MIIDIGPALVDSFESYSRCSYPIVSPIEKASVLQTGNAMKSGTGCSDRSYCSGGPGCHVSKHCMCCRHSPMDDQQEVKSPDT